jgi:hypothetical protein
LPRAIKIYNNLGIQAIPAPATYIVKNEPFDYHGLTFPSLSSMSLMNEYLREQLKTLKDK